MNPPSSWRLLLLVLLLVVAAPLRLAAHEGPEAEIEALTEEMNKFGESPGRLIERAIEYRVLGRWAEAARDLERARQMDPASMQAHRELSRVLFLSGKTNEAIEAVTQAIRFKPSEPIELGGLLILRAEFLRAKRDLQKGLDDCNAAIKLHTGNPEWYILRSDLQARLQLTKERVAGLDQGIVATGAGILEIERVEALIADQQFAAAAEKIDNELRTSRVRSSWLIRRAQVEMGRKQFAAATNDLRAALEEISARFNTRSPDVPLLLDRAVAYDLLGERKEALRLYEQARDAGAYDMVTDRIKKLKDDAEAAEKAKSGDKEKPSVKSEKDKASG